MSDKTYIEALMDAPARSEHDITLQEVLQSKALKKKLGHNLAMIIAAGRRLKHWTDENYINLK